MINQIKSNVFLQPYNGQILKKLVLFMFTTLKFIQGTYQNTKRGHLPLKVECYCQYSGSALLQLLIEHGLGLAGFDARDPSIWKTQSFYDLL